MLGIAARRDAFGDALLEAIGAEGVDLSLVRRDERAPTGLFMRWRDGGTSRVALLPPR
jgi:sugar/nucleoside kinase (ribokinase family)